MTHTCSQTLLGTLLMTGLLASGCTHAIELTPSPTTSSAPRTQSIASAERVPLVLDAVQLSLNGSPQDPSLDLERRFLSAFHQLSLFSHLSQFDGAPVPSQAVVARLSVADATDSHPGQAALKGVVIGASLFLLAPVLDLHYDYGTTLTLELERWDGAVKTYRSAASGTARYSLFAANPGMISELRGHVLESGISDLLEQVVRDTAFYTASSAPIQEQKTFTVSAKLKHRGPVAIPTSHQRSSENP